ncbi:MAG TPA: FUSC family protein [Streptosporangiaceae bacterium]|nr:FUSC family protein [Streptosporangiaceae bacterium]
MNRWWRSQTAPEHSNPARTAVQAVVHATPESLTLARRRAQPRIVYIARLTLTAVAAYLAAVQFAGNKGPVLAPLTALLVVQVSLTHTLRSAAQRVISVVAGVLVAVGLSVVVGFTWWSLGILIAVALTVGLMLRLGDDLLEVPITAMLILSAVGNASAASSRIIETFIGAAAGLIGGLVFTPVRLQPAEDAVDDLSGQLADLLDQIAGDIEEGADTGRCAERLNQARAFGGEIDRVDRALTEAEGTLRVNPGARILPQATIPLRTGLETLERAAVTVRVIARWAADASRPEADSPLRDPEIRAHLTEVLRELAVAVGSVGDHVRAGIATAVAGPPTRDGADRPHTLLHRPVTTGTRPAAEKVEKVESDLDYSLSRAGELQDELADLLRAGPAPALVDWSLRGELLMLLDRLRSDLQEEHQARARQNWPGRGSARTRRPRWVPRPPATRPRGRARASRRAHETTGPQPRLRTRRDHGRRDHEATGPQRRP